LSNGFKVLTFQMFYYKILTDLLEHF
jgi:hypothetical protein